MLTYDIRKHRRYSGGDVLESVTTHRTPDATVELLPHTDDGVINAINRGDIGHHFIDVAEYTYHIVVKAP